MGEGLKPGAHLLWRQAGGEWSCALRVLWGGRGSHPPGGAAQYPLTTKPPILEARRKQGR